LEWLKINKKWIVVVAVMLAITYVVSTLWFQLMLIQGDSMQPAYHNFQLVLLDKREKEYERGDVIAFKNAGLEQKAIVLVKRVVAVPGDTVLIKDNSLYVNGEVSKVYSEDVAFEYAGIASVELILGKDEYFAIGDNVSQSKDSRYPEVGIISLTDIIGKIVNL